MQTPFVTISFGLGINKWERMISKAMLEVRMKGLGTNGLTAVFPKLVFLHRNEVNGQVGSPNFDIKQLAIKCSMKRLYPDFLSLDGGYLGEVYDEAKLAISPMGKSVAHIKPCERLTKAVYNLRLVIVG